MSRRILSTAAAALVLAVSFNAAAEGACDPLGFTDDEITGLAIAAAIS